MFSRTCVCSQAMGFLEEEGVGMSKGEAGGYPRGKDMGPGIPPTTDA